MRCRTTWPLAVWLLLMAIGQSGAVVAVWWVFSATRRGQLLELVAYSGNDIGWRRIGGLIEAVLNGMTVVSLAVATVVVGFIALARRRYALAFVSVMFVAGANATSQILKYRLPRPDRGVNLWWPFDFNGLPSGHATVATSVVVALVLVLPPRFRGLAAVLGAGYATLAGVGTLSAGWHRPSDAVASQLVVGAWAAAAGLALVTLRHAGRPRRRAAAPTATAATAAPAGPAAPGSEAGSEAVPASGAATCHPTACLSLALVGVGLLTLAGLAMALTAPVASTPPSDLSWRRLLIGYVGGASGIAAATTLVISLVLVTVHRVVR